MLWMCCLNSAQEERNELGLLLGAEFIPRAATTSDQKLSFGRSIAYSVDYARRLSSGNTALLLDFPFPAGRVIRWRAPKSTPSRASQRCLRRLRCEFALRVTRPHRRGYLAASDTDFTKEVAYCKTELLTRRYIEASQQRNSAAESTSVPGSNCCSDRLQRRGSGLLHVKHAQLRRSISANTAAQCCRLGIGCPLLAGFGKDRH